MKTVKTILLCGCLGVAMFFCLAYAAGAFMSDKEYAETHPEVFNNEGWEKFFENPKEVN